ncbi:MoaD/ThiS family protein [Candidatus Marifrigoribacter sp. Uisw_064]|jgi:molybdopterin synthase sulfur carrier subunit|uniref:MoaD/ThiS family protein n=1 Tax=Candidatus Marifrigoribacter sp. Uisw_064 TaxID=3230970 RepID=UPI003ADDB83A
MNIPIKYFGLIAEITQCENETIDFSEASLKELLSHLYLKYPKLKDQEFQVAQDQELISSETKLTGKELALLPPFAGG